MLIEARRWHMLGVACIPIQARNKHVDKNALLARGYEYKDLRSTLPTLDDLRYWFKDSRRKLAVMTRPDFICIDFDTWQSHYKFLALYPQLSRTYTVKTKRGYHLYFFLDKPIDKPVKVTWPDICLKDENQNAITHGDGYTVINDTDLLRLNSIFDIPFVEEKQIITPSKKKNVSLSTRCQSTSNRPIQRIKEGLPMSDYLIGLGYDLKVTGKDKYLTLCPFHADIKPSLWVVGDICNCFSCEFDNHLDVLDFHQKLTGCTRNKAIFELASSLGF